LSSSPNDWKSIEVDSRSRELECPVSLKILFSLKMDRAQNGQEVINRFYDIDVSVMLPIFLNVYRYPVHVFATILPVLIKDSNTESK